MAARRILKFLPLAFAAALVCCRGYDTIPAEEADWQRIAPTLVGTPADRIERCAGPPLRSAPQAPGVATLTYRAADLKNYCEVTLSVRDGRIAGFTVDYDAPEFLWLRSGINYCGRIFAQCVR